jgi:ATP-binding cassette subfamily B protein
MKRPSENDTASPAEPPAAVAGVDEEEAVELTGIGTFLRKIADVLTTTPVQATLILLALFVDTAFTIAVPVSFRYLVDNAIGTRNGEALTHILIGLAVGVVVAACAGIGRDFLYARFSISVLNRLRSEMFDRLLHLSMDFFARMEIAGIAARFSTDLASLEGALSAAPAWCLVPALDATVSFVMLFVLDWRLALVGSLVVPVSLLGPRLVIGRAAAANYQRKIDEGELMSVVQESVAAHAVVKAFSLEQAAAGRFNRSLTQLWTSSIRTALYGSLLERSSAIGTLVLQVVVLGVGATMAYRHQITIGSLAAFQSLFLTLSWAVGYVSQYFPYLLQAAAGTRRIDELLRERPRVADIESAAVLQGLREKIRFESVSFGYTPAQRNLTDVSFEFEAGTSVAFVGPSGCGKSTVLNLLMRFYDPEEGRITFDGHDIGRVTLASLRSRIGVVFQDTILFNTTVRENIRLGKLDATDAEVEAAARAAEMHDLIMKFPLGYDTPVGERGGRLSGGQRQRVAIARAILRDPKILVLDEATSALDSETEAAINQTLERLAEGRTVVSVSHRLAGVAKCHRIFVLESGRLAEMGSHDELVTAEGIYSRLWNKQSGLSVDAAKQRAAILPRCLGEIPIFRSLDADQHAALAGMLSTEQIPAGREVFRQGDRGDKLYVVARGTVTVSAREDESEQETLIAVLQDGDHFGEIALINDAPRMATVRTRTDCMFLTLRSDAFFKLLESSPELRCKFERISRERLEASKAEAVRS